MLRRSLSLLILCVLLIGCTGGETSLNSATGKASYKDQPMTGGTIILNPKGNDTITAVKPSGLISEDGSFAVSTNNKLGAPAGKYIATFTWNGPKKVAVASKGMGGEGEDRTSRAGGILPENYTNSKLSTIEIEIQSGSNSIPPINLK